MPMKEILINGYVFQNCSELSIWLGGVHKTISWFHMESWRNDMRVEVNRINQVLPNTPELGKTTAIHQWIRSAIHRMNHYKAEHIALLKRPQLTLRKANLEDNMGGTIEQEQEEIGQ